MIWNRSFYLRKDDCILIRIDNFSTAFIYISSHELLWLRRMIDYLIELFNVPLKNVAFIWRHHYYRWGLATFVTFNLCSALVAFKHDWIFIVTRAHACCDNGPRFLWSHQKKQREKTPRSSIAIIDHRNMSWFTEYIESKSDVPLQLRL